MKKHQLILVILIMTVVSLGLVRLVISNSMTTSGTVLAQITEDHNRYQTENTVLSEKVLKLSSYSHIVEEADKLGFQPKKTAFSISNVLPIALKR